MERKGKMKELKRLHYLTGRYAIQSLHEKELNELDELIAINDENLQIFETLCYNKLMKEYLRGLGIKRIPDNFTRKKKFQ